ncbi:MAG TPA: sigma-70 family RNA polymerase sigma factor [Terriglobales bacterium]|nr:sigma-70 family RNA polymerase sigma factor [Terriglobales bacterium]
MTAKLTFDDVRGLYQKHGAALLGYATSLLGDRASAEDVLHQVFLKLLGMRSLPQDARPYLFKAVRNRALNTRRNVGRMTSLEDQEWLVKPEGMVEAGLEVERALQRLPAEQREVVVMRIWGDMTFEEIAGILGLSINTAASRYRYALEKLRAHLKYFEASQ